MSVQKLKDNMEKYELWVHLSSTIIKKCHYNLYIDYHGLHPQIARLRQAAHCGGSFGFCGAKSEKPQDTAATVETEKQ